MMDNYWLKSGKENVKEKIKKENDELLMTSLDKYWEQKGKQEEKPAEEADEEAKA